MTCIIPNKLYIGAIGPLGEVVPWNIKAIIDLAPSPFAFSLYISSPIIDGPLPYEGILKGITLWAAEHIKHDYPVLVRCAAGVNRSGLVAALIAREVLGGSGKEARLLVQSQQHTPLNNPAFIAYLDSLEAP